MQATAFHFPTSLVIHSRHNLPSGLNAGGAGAVAGGGGNGGKTSCMHSKRQVILHNYTSVKRIPVHAYIIFSCLYDPFWVKNDIGRGIHNLIIHYNCTIGSFLLHSFLLLYHPYPPSFHEMIFTLVPLIFLSLEHQGAPKMLIRPGLTLRTHAH